MSARELSKPARRARVAPGLACSALVAFAAFACSGPDRARSAAEKPAAGASGRTELAPARRADALAAPAPLVLAPAPVAPELATRALALAHHGDARGACALLANELAGRLAAPAQGDALARCDSVVALLAWWQLTENDETWSEALPALDELSRRAAHAPAELAAYVEAFHAVCLRRTGDSEKARAVSRSLGFVTDWRILGPFDNERGKGFGVASGPEKELDFSARVPGKAREVGWRANPAPDHPGGFVVLDEVLRPSQQVLAYLATGVESERARDAALHVASTGAIQVFVNGSSVLSRDVHRPAFFDQDRAAIALQPGWNRIVVKTCVEDVPDWVVGVRLCELDGRPLALRVDSARAADPVPKAASAKKPEPGTRELLDALAKDDPKAARLLALFHLITRPDDRAAHSARAAVALALAKEPDDVATLYLQALASAPDDRTTREEMEVDAWIRPLREVVRRDPRHVAALCDLARFHLDHDPLAERADALSAQALATAPKDPRALGVRIGALNDLERNDESDELARRLNTEVSAWTDAGVRARAHEEIVAGRRDGALAVLEQGFARDPLDTGVFRELVSEYADRGRAAEITRVTARVVDAIPASIAARAAAARALESLGELAAARALLERAQAIAPEDTDLLLALSRLDQRGGDVAKAVERLDEILRIDPTQDKVRRQRELLVARDEHRFEEPYAWDARTVLSEVDRAWQADEPFTVLERTHVHKVNKDGTHSSYEHVLLRIQNDGGVKALDAYGLFYPEGATLSVKRVRLLHADGSSEAAPAPRGGDRSAGGGSVRVYDLPPLQVGDAVEVESYSDTSVPSVFGNYFGLRDEFYADQPDGLAPVWRSELVVISARDLELHFKERHAERLERSEALDAEGRKVRRYVARELVRPKPESAMPRRSELAPAVDVTTYASWQDFAAWWWSFIQKEFESSPAMKDKVRELTAGASDEHAKIQALVRFVGQEIRYNAWPFGTHGYQPFSAPTIFERRFGDCKDKSILLCQMLAEIGVHAHPVLIMAEAFRPEEPLDAALVEHFNHCIAYVPEHDGQPGQYLDCTADRNPIDYLRLDDQGARVLHVDAGAGSVHDIPYAPPAENQMLRRYEVALDEKGDGEVVLVDESNGGFGVRLRSSYGGEKGDIEKRLARELRESFARVDIADVKTSRFEDIGEPARLEVRFRARRLWAEEQGGASLRLSFDPLGLERIAVESREQRTHDVVLDRPFAQETVLRYRLPAGAKVASLPPKVEVRVAGMLSYVQEVREVDGGVEARHRFELEKRRIPLAEYAEFQTALREIQLAEQRTVRLELAGKATPR